MIPVREFELLDSTNLEAKRCAENGDIGPVWIRADHQSAGRGRSGRDWVSEQGNLFTTLLMPFDAGPQKAALLGYVAALSIAGVLDQFLDPASTRFKWPNDVLVNDRKISGILLETGTSSGQAWVAVGIGVNLTSSPEEARLPATSIAHASGNAQIDIATAMDALRAAFAAELSRFEVSGFTATRLSWLDRASRLNEMIEARLPRETIQGVFEGIDENGMLLLRTTEGLKQIAAADVHFA